MAAYTLYLREPKAEESVVLIAIREKNQRIVISTNIKVIVEFWGKGEVAKKHPESTFINEKLNKIKYIIGKLLRVAEIEGWELEEIKEKIYIELFNKKFENKNKLLDFYQKWATVGTAKKTNPTKNDLNSYRIFKEYVGTRNISFNDINMKFYNDFVLWLRKTKKYRENTVGAQVKRIKAVMNEAYKQKIHNNTDYLMFNKLCESKENINLTPEELEKIINIKLPATHEIARDVFVVGCYVAQRFSDYSRICEDDIKDGYLHINQEKTNHKIIIPVHPVAREILKKYGGRLPFISATSLNKKIKEIAKAAGIDDKVYIRYTKAGREIEEYVEKYKLITTHTARKTGVTNALRAGIPIEDCMYLAGIKDNKTFRIYAGVNDFEYAHRLAISNYFSGKDDQKLIIEYVRKTLDSGENPEWLEILKKEIKK